MDKPPFEFPFNIDPNDPYRDEIIKSLSEKGSMNEAIKWYRSLLKMAMDSSDEVPEAATKLYEEMQVAEPVFELPYGIDPDSEYRDEEIMLAANILNLEMGGTMNMDEATARYKKTLKMNMDSARENGIEIPQKARELYESLPDETEKKKIVEQNKQTQPPITTKKRRRRKKREF